MMTFRPLALAAAFMAAFVLPASAERLTGTGVATMEGGRLAAREAAIADALDDAALSREARLTSTDYVDGGRVATSSRLSASPLPPGKVSVLEEGERDGLYRVKVAVDSSPRARAGGGDSCADGRGADRSVKRRILTSYIYLDHPQDASDLGRLSTGLPSELARRLGRLPGFAVRDGGAYGVLPDARVTDPASGLDEARALGRREDVQFVLAGRVVDSSGSRNGVQFSIFDADTSRPGLFYNGPLAGLFGGLSAMREPLERRFDLELWVYDAFSGALLVSERFATTARGRVVDKTMPPFASSAFWEGDYGRAIDALLDQATARVDKLLACVPFMTRVARVEGGRLFLGEGTLSGLKVGDSLLVYKQRPASQLRAAGSERRLGLAERVAGDATVIQVQPNLAVAQMRNGKAAVEPGDLVRFVPGR